MLSDELSQLLNERRWCFVVDALSYDEHGYIPSVAIEDQPGHIPLSGNGVGSSPWYWGKTLEDAERTCKSMNEKRGLSDKDCALIALSTMRKVPRS